MAERIKVGCRIKNAENVYEVVRDINARHVEAGEAIYNLNVEEYHTYFVGENSVLVHNDCSVSEADLKTVADVGNKGDAEVKSVESSGIKDVEGSEGVGNVVEDYIDGIKIIDGKVDGKILVDEFKNIRTESIQNVNSDTITLGKYKPTVKPDGSLDWTIPENDSYTIMAGDTTYFSLGNEWNVIKNKYNITDEDMFELFNIPALNDAMSSGKTIRFSHNPEDFPNCALENEWKYIQEQGGYTRLMKIGDFWYAKK